MADKQKAEGFNSVSAYAFFFRLITLILGCTFLAAFLHYNDVAVPHLFGLGLCLLLIGRIIPD